MLMLRRRSQSGRRRTGNRRPSRRVRYYAPLDDLLGLEIQAAIRLDSATGGRLRWCEPGLDAPEFDGDCAVAATAYFFLAGEELAGLAPLAPVESVDWKSAGRVAYTAGYRAFCSYGGGHWWLERRQNDGESQVIDLTIGADDPNDAFPYVERGHGQKFVGPGYTAPSRRGRELIRLVKNIRLVGLSADADGRGG